MALTKNIDGERVTLSIEDEDSVRADWAIFDAKEGERKITAISDIVQAHLDAEAKLRGYDSIHTAVTYADEPSAPTFQVEGAALRAWRSAVWTSCYALLAEWEAGNISEPTADDVLAQLPAAPS